MAASRKPPPPQGRTQPGLMGSPNDRVLWDSLQRADADLVDELRRAAARLQELPWEISAEVALPRRELIGQRGMGAEEQDRWASYWLAYGPFAGRLQLTVIRKVDGEGARSETVDFADLSPDTRLAAAQLLPELVRLLKKGLSDRLREMQDAKSSIAKTLNRLDETDTLRRQSPSAHLNRS